VNQCCARSVFVACESLERKVRQLESDLGAQPEPELVAAAKLAEALDALSRVMALHKGNEFAWPPEQAALRHAAAVLAENGRKP
jgi:hypothetical protein